RFRFICPSFVRPDSKSFWRKFLGAGHMQLAGWIERRAYSNKDYFWTLHDTDPFDYDFKPEVVERVSDRRNLAVRNALRKAETVPAHIRSEASSARVAASA
ncbi:MULTISPECIES: hypothetical protein, partial [unclassified Bradyrhizobium]|uniref:hypothetical protein n=1 Tax=unclassified Bradyrhizobium TaxID=2631580 RepID=UPI0028E203C0